VLGLVGALCWLWKQKKGSQPTELDTERRETVYEVDGYAKPSELEAKESGIGRAAGPIHELSSEQLNRKDP
jgi:hypothetical protein